MLNEPKKRKLGLEFRKTWTYVVRVVDIKELSGRYKKTRSREAVGFLVPKVELFGSWGFNGAGKNTPIRILTGLTVRTGGTLKLYIGDINSHSVDAKRPCGLVTQAINLDRELTLTEILEVPGCLWRAP